MPAEGTIYTWLMREPEFEEIYNKAKEKQMEVFAAQIIDLADNCPADADHVAKVKLQVHARQWLMGKLKPKKYGDNLTLKGDKDNPLVLNIASALDAAITQHAASQRIAYNPDSVIDVTPIPLSQGNGSDTRALTPIEITQEND